MGNEASYGIRDCNKCEKRSRINQKALVFLFGILEMSYLITFILGMITGVSLIFIALVIVVYLSVADFD